MDYGALAIEAHKQDRLADAVNYYRLHLAEQPGSALGWLAFGMLLHMKIGDVRGAIDCYRQSLALTPDNPTAELHLGRALALVDRQEEAVFHLRRYLGAEPNGATSAYAELTCSLLRLNRLDEAAEVAAACRAAHPDDFFPPYLMAWIATARGAFDEALSYVADTVSLDPRLPIPLGLRGNLLAQLGRVDEARRTLQEMAEVHASIVAASLSSEEHLAVNRLWREVKRDAKERLGVPQSQAVNFIALFGGLGDQFFLASALRSFKKANTGLPLVAICSPKAQWETLFPGAADLFYRLETEQIRQLMACGRFFADHPYVPFFPWMGPLISWLTLTQSVRFLMGLPQSAELEKPTIPETVRRQSLDLFNSLGGKPGRSVLISNLSNSNPMAGDGWWRALVDELSRAGFVVFQNMANMWSANPKDILSPAIPVDIPLENVIPFCEEGGYFIGVRSGLCDLLGYARARMKTVHVKRRYATNERYPISVWIDHHSGLSLRRCFDNDCWDDIEVEGDAPFDPALIADWIAAPTPTS
jgi:tetratricopeptide (TPR) repeat protein